MVLPVPSSERIRQLLQAVWDLSWHRRDRRAGWPTLADLLGALQRTPYPSFGEGEAEALLARLPVGLINGVGPDGGSTPDSGGNVTLTVAGVAACQDTKLLVRLFVRFIQHAVPIEASWRQQGIALPLLGRPQADFPRSDAMFIYRDFVLPRLSSQRDMLLGRLHLMLASEPGLWVDISPYGCGNWTVTIDRRIRYFTGIQNLSDYWARCFKPWEVPGQLMYPVMATRTGSVQAGPPRVLNDRPGLLDDVLLGRIFDLVEEHFDRHGKFPGAVLCPKIDPDIDTAVVRTALFRLQAAGRICLREGASAGLPDVRLTSDGARHISALRRCWADHALRDRAVRDALLEWLYDQRIRKRSVSGFEGFFYDPRSAYSGQFFSVSDVEDAERYLLDKNLIEQTGDSVLPVLRSYRITASGLDCIEQGGSVADSARQPAGTSISYSFNAPVSGTNVAIGDNATQHATGGTVDAASVRTLIQAVVEALPILGLDARILDETKDAATQAAAEIGQQQPDRRHPRTALGKIRDHLAQAGNQALAAVLSAAIDYERNKLGLPPAS